MQTDITVEPSRNDIISEVLVKTIPVHKLAAQVAAFVLGASCKSGPPHSTSRVYLILLIRWHGRADI